MVSLKSRSEPIESIPCHVREKISHRKFLRNDPVLFHSSLPLLDLFFSVLTTIVSVKNEVFREEARMESIREKF